MQFITASEKYCTLEEHIAAPIFRRAFNIDSAVNAASLSITANGFYELYVNGENITRTLLAPYISNPNHLLYLDAYDIAPYLKVGKNAIAVILGNGFANQDAMNWDFHKASFRASPRFALSSEIKTEKGDLKIESDERFRVKESPILFDMYRLGVIYDAREDTCGFATPELDDSEWGYAKKCYAPLGKITPSRVTPIRVRESLRPCKIERQSDFYYIHRKDGSPVEKCYVKDGWLYDFGINTSGVTRLKIRGARGQKITVRHAEGLRDGYFSIGSIVTLDDMTERSLEYLQTDVYFLKGGEEEIFTPPFTYHGFRYALVEGISEEQATEDLLTFEVFNTDVKGRTKFKSSNEVLNRLFEMGINSDLSNFHHLPTDCPHREKNGWTGDVSVSAHQLIQSFNCAKALGIWLESARYAQTSEGKLPGIIPTDTWGYSWGSGPAWDAAIVNLPYYAYRYDGSVDIIYENADMIKRYLEYIYSRRDERGLIACGLGDWCQPREKGAKISSPLEFTDSTQVLDMARKSAQLFDVIGMTDAAARAKEIEDSMRCAIKTHLIDNEGAMAEGCCQTSQAIALRFGLFDKDSEARAYANLIKMIEEKDGHLNVGMIGMRHIFHLLFERGDSDLAIKMITREDAPSYGYMAAAGGTALFESTVPNGVQESENHHFYGDILHLFVSKLAGIRINSTLKNHKSAVISPTIPRSVDSASAGYTFTEGTLSVNWRKCDGEVRVEINVPYGIDARLEYQAISEKLPEGVSIHTLPIN